MTNRRLKKSVIYGIYSLVFIGMIGLIYVLESNIPKKQFDNNEYSYVSKTIFDDVIPVISTEEKITKPYNADDVKVLKTYYDYKGEETSQQNSLIYYENTYMQSSGISYGKEDIFDVISILPGTVEEVKEDEILGKVVKIKHNDNVISLYQCLSETTINKGDTVIQGQVIGQSGSCNLEKDIKNHVYFELIINNETVNPENYYGKTLNEIQG
ncbi:MAG: M23 family metallopeptidase [Lactobacillales bacterium]|nr:M23 family metallopeptidase [Lactobacillales bacterium]